MDLMKNLKTRYMSILRYISCTHEVVKSLEEVVNEMILNHKKGMNHQTEKKQGFEGMKTSQTDNNGEQRCLIKNNL